MSVRRAIALGKLCRRHLDLHEGNVMLAANDSPRSWGTLTKKPGSKEHNPHTLIQEAFDNNTIHLLNHHWKKLFLAWYNGGLDKQIQAAINCLPEVIAKKYRGKP